MREWTCPSHRVMRLCIKRANSAPTLQLNIHRCINLMWTSRANWFGNYVGLCSSNSDTHRNCSSCSIDLPKILINHNFLHLSFQLNWLTIWKMLLNFLINTKLLSIKLIYEHTCMAVQYLMNWCCCCPVGRLTFQPMYGSQKKWTSCSWSCVKKYFLQVATCFLIKKNKPYSIKLEWVIYGCMLSRLYQPQYYRKTQT